MVSFLCSQPEVIDAHHVGGILPLSPCPLVPNSLSYTFSTFRILALMTSPPPPIQSQKKMIR